MIKTVIAGIEGVIRVEKRESLQLSYGFLRLKSVCSLISSGTELHYAKRAMEQNNDLCLGYCVSGIVTEIGEGVTGFNVGDRVTAMGLNQAYHAEEVCVPYKLCVKLQDDLSFDDAVFANLLATAVNAERRIHVKQGEKVLIIGAGIVGQLLYQYVLTRTNHVVIADINELRLSSLRKQGIKTVNCLTAEWNLIMDEYLKDGVDTAFLCLNGDGTDTFMKVVNIMRRGFDGNKKGNIVCVGRFSIQLEFNVELGNINILNVSRCGAGYKDLDYETGKKMYKAEENEFTVTDNLIESVNSIADGRINLSNIHTNKFSIDDAPQAYQTIKNDTTAIGVTLHYC